MELEYIPGNKKDCVCLECRKVPESERKKRLSGLYLLHGSFPCWAIQGLDSLSSRWMLLTSLIFLCITVVFVIKTLSKPAPDAKAELGAVPQGHGNNGKKGPKCGHCKEYGHKYRECPKRARRGVFDLRGCLLSKVKAGAGRSFVARTHTLVTPQQS